MALQQEMATQFENILGEALREFPVPSVDLSEALDGVPAGTALQIGTTETSPFNGFLLIQKATCGNSAG